LTSDQAIREIEEALQNVPVPEGPGPEPIAPDEWRRLAVEVGLLVMLPADRRWLLPQIMLDFLRRPDEPDPRFGLDQLLSDLNVAEKPDPEYYKNSAVSWEAGEAERRQRILERLTAEYQESYHSFTAKEAAAVVAFLDAVRDRVGDEVALRDWTGAREYWSRRAAAE